jgi:hypothetical protein
VSKWPRSYFGKSARDLTSSEGALLAGITKGPNYYSPVRNVDRARERFRYVLGRMQDDGAITAEENKQARAAFPDIVPDDQIERAPGSYFADYVARELAGTSSLSAFRVGSYRIRSTLQPDLQKAVDLALQEGLANYEKGAGRVEFQGPELNLSAAIERATRGPIRRNPSWLRAKSARLPRDSMEGRGVAKGGRRNNPCWLVRWPHSAALRQRINSAASFHDVVCSWWKAGRAQPGQSCVFLIVQRAAVVIKNGAAFWMAAPPYAGNQLK